MSMCNLKTQNVALCQVCLSVHACLNYCLIQTKPCTPDEQLVWCCRPLCILPRMQSGWQRQTNEQ